MLDKEDKEDLSKMENLPQKKKFTLWLPIYLKLMSTII